MERYSSVVDARAGLIAGMAAYILSLGFVVGSHRLGMHPESGLWLRNFTVGEYIVVHAGTTLPVWSGSLQTELLGHTAILLATLILAGYLAGAVSSGGNSFQSGSSVVVGYLPATLLAMAYAAVSVEALTWVDLLAPVVLAGVVVPLVCGGLGGWLHSRLE